MNERNPELTAIGIRFVMGLEPEKIKSAASDICSWVQDAVGDMANDYSYLCMDSQWSAKVERAKKDGITDLKGWLADEYYNDVDTLEDLCGDRIHDAATQTLGRYEQPFHDMIFVLICLEMEKHSHPALIRALKKMRKRHRESIDKWKKTTQKPTS